MRIFVDECTKLDEVLREARSNLASSPEAELEFAALEAAAHEFQGRLCDLAKHGIRTELKKQLTIAGESVTLQAGPKSSRGFVAAWRRLFGG